MDFVILSLLFCFKERKLVTVSKKQNGQKNRNFRSDVLSCSSWPGGEKKVPPITLYNASKYKLNSSNDAVGAAASQKQAFCNVPNIAFFIGQPSL